MATNTHEDEPQYEDISQLERLERIHDNSFEDFLRETASYDVPEVSVLARFDDSTNIISIFSNYKKELKDIAINVFENEVQVQKSQDLFVIKVDLDIMNDYRLNQISDLFDEDKNDVENIKYHLEQKFRI